MNIKFHNFKGLPGDLQRFVNSLMAYPPSEQWLYTFCQKHEIILKNQETLEALRRSHGKKSIINCFYSKNQQIFRKDPRLIWNVDETSSASNKKYKVLCQKEMLPLTEIENLSEHYTGLFPFNASGNKLMPTIILPNICYLPNELKGLQAHFFSQKSGWMTNFLWNAFSIFFSHDISKFRLSLPVEIRWDEILLLVDCHGSRISSFAIEYLKIFNITLITLPSHTTHILQPFDVCVAKSLKSRISKYSYSPIYNIQAINFNSKRKKVRYLTVLSMIDAWSSLDPQILRNGFYYTGIYPFNPKMGLNSKYVTENINDQEIFQSKRNTFDISNRNLSSNDERLRIGNHYYNQNFLNVDQIPKPDKNNVNFYLYSQTNISSGKVLSSVPAMISLNMLGNLSILY